MTNNFDLFSRATHVVTAEVEDLKSYWNENHTMIFSDAVLSVKSVLKGSLDAGPVIVRTMGGMVGHEGLLVSGEARFKVGEVTLLYMERRSQGYFEVVAGGRGKTDLIASNSGFGDPPPSVPPSTTYGYVYEGYRYYDAEDPEIQFYINERGTAQTANEFTAVVNGFQTWEDDPGSDVEVIYRGTTSRETSLGSSTNVTDGYNVVAWVTTLSSEYTARTVCHVESFFAIFIDECDMELNDNIPWSDHGESGKHDIQSLATHEAGHFLELLDLYGSGDAMQTMYGAESGGTLGDITARTLEWGDIAGVRQIYPNTLSVSGWFGADDQGPDIALRDIDKNGVLDEIVLWVDNPGGANTIYYKVGWNVDTNGAVCGTCWTSQKPVGGTDGTGSETSGAGVVLSDLNSNGILDMLVFWIDAPSGADVMYYRIGWDINTSGDVASSSWTLKKTVGGGSIGNDISGGGATLANLDSNIRPDVVVTWIDNPGGANTMYYRVGWNIDTAGNVCGTCWTANKVVSSSVGDSSAGGGIASAVWFTDEFSESINGQWTTQAGTWALESGELSGSGTSARVVSTKTFSSDRTFQVRFHAISAGPSSWYAPWLGGKYIDEYNRAVVILHTTGNLNLAISQGGSTNNYNVQTSLNVYDWHTAKMVFVGNNAKIYIDNVLYFDVTDSKIGALGNSKIQLASWGPTHSHFDDVMVDDSIGKPDLVFSWIDNPYGDNKIYYRVAWDVDVSGNPGSWSNSKWTPGIAILSDVGGIGSETQGGGVAVADINRNGYLEMVFAWVDNPFGENHGYCRIEWESRVDSHL